MVFLDNDGFLAGVARMFEANQNGSVFVTMKRYTGKADGRGKSGKNGNEQFTLIRATNGKSKISSLIAAKDIVRFQLAYATVLKGHMTSLKKKERNRGRKGKNKTPKPAAAAAAADSGGAGAGPSS